ncbi:hypothetical protein K438DRAFT_1785403 [Mycena galopus ATCC 62051]|nr:hypothetical protein K438DRAFT_1785403 [Mycena galopus ATCC 62051]
MSVPTTTKQLLVQSRHWILALTAVQAVVCIFILQSRFWDSASGARAPGMLEALSPDSMALYTTLSAKDTMSIFWRDGVTEMYLRESDRLEFAQETRARIEEQPEKRADREERRRGDDTDQRIYLLRGSYLEKRDTMLAQTPETF